MATLVTSWRSVQEAVRTPTRARALPARARRSDNRVVRGAASASRLPARQERPRRLGVAQAGGLGGGVFQRPGCHQRGRRGGGLGRLRRQQRGVPVKKIHDYIHFYRGYWSEGGKCRIKIYREDGHTPVVISSAATGSSKRPEELIHRSS